jgi:hypothetical protein
MTIPLIVGSDVLRSYKRLSYSPWHALAEFVDNSTQSYFDNKDALDGAYANDGEPLEVRFAYDRSTDLLRISDNAMGMSSDELRNALRIGRPPANSTGRSQYGLGLKTAACWFGDEWTVTTKKLGESNEYSITVDVEKVAGGETDLPVQTLVKTATLHYTTLEIRKLHSKLLGRTIGKIKQYLRSMYRVDLREGRLKLFWEGDPLEWDVTHQFLRNRRGELYFRNFTFQVNERSVSGHIGILGEGSSGRPNAGFSILRRGRVIRGHPDSWRPEAIFGQEQGSNNLINQRITGEIHLDMFEVSHTKDDILWQGDEEERVQEQLRKEADEFIQVAKSHRKGKGTDARGPTETEIQTAVDELRTELESKHFVDLIELETVPPPEIVEQVNAPMLESAEREEPRFRVILGELTILAFISTDDSANDPYFATEYASNEIIVVVNQRHPHWSQLMGSEGVLNYLRHCVYDAVAEWKCWKQSAPLQPNTIKLIKDALLRLPTEIEEDIEGLGESAPLPTESTMPASSA